MKSPTKIMRRMIAVNTPHHKHVSSTVLNVIKCNRAQRNTHPLQSAGQAAGMTQIGATRTSPGARRSQLARLQIRQSKSRPSTRATGTAWRRHQWHGRGHVGRVDRANGRASAVWFFRFVNAQGQVVQPSSGCEYCSHVEALVAPVHEAVVSMQRPPHQTLCTSTSLPLLKHPPFAVVPFPPVKHPLYSYHQRCKPSGHQR